MCVECRSQLSCRTFDKVPLAGPSQKVKHERPMPAFYTATQYVFWPGFIFRRSGLQSGWASSWGQVSRRQKAHLLLLLEDDEFEEELLLLLLLELELPLASSLCAARSSATDAKSGRASRSADSSLTDIFGRPFFVRRHACNRSRRLHEGQGCSTGSALCVSALLELLLGSGRSWIGLQA